MERQNNNIIEGASLYALESRAEKIRSRYVGASVRRGESDRHKIGGTAFDSVSGGETTRVTGRYDETFAALNVKANTVDTLIEGKLSFTCQQDNFIMGGVYNETIIGGILITSGMSDGMTGGGGIRLTVPLDISLVGLIGLEEKFGAALADAVMIELSITHFEREFVSAIYNIGVWTRTGMMHATLATTAFSLLKVSVGVRSLTPGAGAAAEPGADAPVGSPTTGTLPSSTPPASAAGSGAVVRADGSVFIPQATGGYTRSYEVGKATATVLPTLDDVANAEDFASISRAAANLDNTADTATSATRHLDALDLIHEGSRADALADVADVEDVARIDELSDALDTAAPLDDTASPAAVQNALDNGSINPQLLDNPDDLGDGNIYDTLNRGSDTDPQYNTLNRNSSDPQGYGTLNRGADTDAQGYGTLNGGSADNVDAQGYHSLERGSTDHLDAQGYHSLDRGSDNFLDPQGYHSLDRNPSTYLDGEPIYADVVRKTDASPVLRTDPADSGGKTRWGQMPLPDGAADELGGAADELGTAADDVDARTYDALRLQDPVDDPLTAGSPIPRADPSDAGGKTKWGQLPLPEGAADELGTAADDLGAADDVDERLYATVRLQGPVNNRLKVAPDAPPASLNIDIYADDDLLGLPANAGAVEVSPAQLDVGDLDAIDDSSMFDGSYGAFGQTDATPAQKYSDAAVAAASDGDLLSPPPPPTRKDPRDVAPPVKIKASTYEDIFEDDLAPPAAATNNSPAPSAVDDGGGYAAVPDSTPLVDPSEIDDFSLDGVPDFHAGQEVTTFDEAKDLAASLKSYDFESEFDELHSYGQKLRGTQGERPNWQAASVVHQGEVKLNELVRSTLQGLDGGELVDLQPIEDLQAVTGRQQLMAFVEAAEASGDQQKLIDATNAVAAFDQQARQLIEATTLEAQRIAGLPIPMVDETVDAARLADALDEQVQAQMANSEWASAIERDPTKTVKVPESERIGYSHQVTALASASDALRAGEDPIARLDEEIIRLRDTIAQGGDPADNQAKIAAYQKIRDMVADTLQSPAFKREAQPVAPNAGAGAAAGRLDDAQPIPIPEEYPSPQLNNGAADWDVPVEESSHYMDIDDLPGAGGGASTTANDAVPAPTYSVGEEINAAGGGTDGASSINETADIFDDGLYGTVAPTSIDEVEPSEALSAADAAALDFETNFDYLVSEELRYRGAYGDEFYQVRPNIKLQSTRVDVNTLSHRTLQSVATADELSEIEHLEFLTAVQTRKKIANLLDAATKSGDTARARELASTLNELDDVTKVIIDDALVEAAHLFKKYAPGPLPDNLDQAALAAYFERGRKTLSETASDLDPFENADAMRTLQDAEPFASAKTAVEKGLDPIAGLDNEIFGLEVSARGGNTTAADKLEEYIHVRDIVKKTLESDEFLLNPAVAQGDEGLNVRGLDVVDDVPVEPVNPMDLDPNARVAPPKKRSARVAKLKQDQVRVSFSDQVEVRQIRLDGDGDELPPRRPLRRTTEELRSGATLHDSPDHLRRRELLPFDQLGKLLAVPLTGARRSNLELKPDDLFTIQEVITLKDGQRQFETVQEILDATTPVTRTTIHKSFMQRFEDTAAAAHLSNTHQTQFNKTFASLRHYRDGTYRGGGTPRFLDRTDTFWRILRDEGYSVNANKIALSLDGWEWNAGRAADDLRDYLLDTNPAYKADFTAAGGDTSNLRLANYM